MKNVIQSTNLTVDQLLELKMNNLIAQRDRLNIEINRVQSALGTKPKPLSEFKKEKESSTLKLSVKDVRNAIVSFSRRKNDYFALNEVKRQCFPNEFNSLTVKDRAKMTCTFQAAIVGLNKKGLVLSKESPTGKSNEKLYLIKDAATITPENN
jgi:hypothetical protein